MGRGLLTGCAESGRASSRRALVALAPADGVTGVSLVRGRPTRRVTNRCGLSKGEAMPAGRPGGGRKLAAPALGCSLGRPVQGVRKGTRKRDAFVRTKFFRQFFHFHENPSSSVISGTFSRENRFPQKRQKRPKIAKHTKHEPLPKREALAAGYTMHDRDKPSNNGCAAHTK